MDAMCCRVVDGYKKKGMRRRRSVSKRQTDDK